MESLGCRLVSMLEQEPGQREGTLWVCRETSQHGRIRSPWSRAVDIKTDWHRSLYIQALNAMQQTPENDLLSWFQIAGERASPPSTLPILTAVLGIHGRPYISWDNIEWNSSAPEVGYCPHSSTLFPTVRFLFQHFPSSLDHELYPSAQGT